MDGWMDGWMDGEKLLRWHGADKDGKNTNL